MLRLYTYFRSSAAFRVRIALNLKGLPYDSIPIHLLRDGGQQHTPDYRATSPLGTVPALETGDGIITQSLAIIEYLEETHPIPALLPAGPTARARVRSIAQTIACEIHPLNNLRVLTYLKNTLTVDEAATKAWYCHWVGAGLAAVETMLKASSETGEYCHGDVPTMADCCLVPQVFNARRFNCSLEAMPTIRRIVGRCESLDAFQRAAPDNQADRE
ncbi:MAG: maleylacetoacetate isomerase [Rhodocyclaceae bacterium]|nr:MAG: maleylacetoacetate isomerase [Rhodocyclaceae bacterium]